LIGVGWGPEGAMPIISSFDGAPGAFCAIALPAATPAAATPAIAMKFRLVHLGGSWSELMILRLLFKDIVGARGTERSLAGPAALLDKSSPLSAAAAMTETRRFWPKIMGGLLVDFRWSVDC
jgi:hypothetical protein